MKKKRLREALRTARLEAILAKAIPKVVTVEIELGATGGGPSVLSVPFRVDQPMRVSLPALGFEVSLVKPPPDPSAYWRPSTAEAPRKASFSGEVCRPGEAVTHDLVREYWTPALKVEGEAGSLRYLRSVRCARCEWEPVIDFADPESVRRLVLSARDPEDPKP